MAITEPSLAFSAALILLAYLIGSVPFAVVVSKLMGLQDPRSYGSKNPGATNVLRTGNKTAAALTLLGDAAKGWFAVWLAQRLAPGITPGPLAAVAVAAFLGHLYPIFLGFKGGKGVATFLGTLIALAWPVGLACCATWLVMALIFRISSLAALAAAGSSTFWMLGLGQGRMVILGMILTLLVYYRHAANIQRMRAGTEPKIGKKQA